MLQTRQTSEIVTFRTTHFPDQRPFYGIQPGILKGLEGIMTGKVDIPSRRPLPLHQNL